MKKPANPTTHGQHNPDPHTETTNGENTVLAVIAAMPEPDRVIGERHGHTIPASRASSHSQ